MARVDELTGGSSQQVPADWPLDFPPGHWRNRAGWAGTRMPVYFDIPCQHCGHVMHRHDTQSCPYDPHSAGGVLHFHPTGECYEAACAMADTERTVRPNPNLHGWSSGEECGYTTRDGGQRIEYHYRPWK